MNLVKNFSLPIVNINYPFDIEHLTNVSKKVKNDAISWKNPLHNYQVHEWKIVFYKDFYIEQIMKDLNIQASPRFVFQAPNYFLKPHRDIGTQCSLNIVLSNDNTPVIFDEVEYVYKSALLDVQKLHSVKTASEERILLKFSIFNKTFNDLIFDSHFSKFISYE